MTLITGNTYPVKDALKLTKVTKTLMRRALGLETCTLADRVAPRNVFWTRVDHPTFLLLTKNKLAEWNSEYGSLHLTRLGAEMVLEPGESLPADFA